MIISITIRVLRLTLVDKQVNSPVFNGKVGGLMGAFAPSIAN